MDEEDPLELDCWIYCGDTVSMKWCICGRPSRDPARNISLTKFDMSFQHQNDSHYRDADEAIVHGWSLSLGCRGDHHEDK